MRTRLGLAEVLTWRGRVCCRGAAAVGVGVGVGVVRLGIKAWRRGGVCVLGSARAGYRNTWRDTAVGSLR